MKWNLEERSTAKERLKDPWLYEKFFPRTTGKSRKLAQC